MWKCTREKNKSTSKCNSNGNRLCEGKRRGKESVWWMAWGARWELPWQSFSCFRVGALDGLSPLCLAGLGIHGRPSQTPSCHILSWHSCMSLPADLTHPSVGYRWATLVPVWPKSLVCPCSGVLLTASLWINPSWGAFVYKLNCFQISQDHPRDGQQERAHFHTYQKKTRKLLKFPGSLFISVSSGSDQLGPGTPRGPSLRTPFAFTRWIHLLQKHTYNSEVVFPFWHLTPLLRQLLTVCLLLWHMSSLGVGMVSALLTAMTSALVMCRRTG